MTVVEAVVSNMSSEIAPEIQVASNIDDIPLLRWEESASLRDSLFDQFSERQTERVIMANKDLM
jgi:hypothetical protein